MVGPGPGIGQARRVRRRFEGVPRPEDLMPSVVRPAALLLLALTACADGRDRGSVACGLAAMNGPLVALQGFARGDALAAVSRVLAATVAAPEPI